MGKISSDTEVPLYKQRVPKPPPRCQKRTPVVSDNSRNCVACYAREKKERKTMVNAIQACEKIIHNFPQMKRFRGL
ncbi:hypothetical protein BaRGS_00004502 [Batillaria attramentaria]|uniref:Uncharacterized protein n=1 Tax=Batillaria attramentaria TaxID=370345 RepID=A0ABD0LYV7_9CAEN